MSLIEKLNALCKEAPIIISSIGPIASGKSFFLSAFHNELGYPTKGIKIEKLKINDIFFESRILRKKEDYKNSHELLEQILERQKLGIRRLAGTSAPDKLRFFANVENKIIPVDFYAPGGHDTAIKLDKKTEGVLYFVDSNFAAYSNSLEEKELEVWGRGVGKIYVFQYSIKDSISPGHPENKKGIGFGLPFNSDNTGWCLEKYNGEILGNVVDSIYKSKIKMKEVLDANIPLETVIKKDNKSEYHFNSDGNIFMEGDLIKKINNSIKTLTQRYIDYLKLHNEETLNELNIRIPEKDFILIDENIHVNIIDSANHKNKNVRNLIYNLVEKVLVNKGYKTSDLKLINFTESKDPRTSHYKNFIKD